MSQPPRYAPGRPFPPYAFTPRRDPHPRNNPAGHSYGIPEVPAPEPPDPERWRESEDYLFGVDCYNHGYLWEAHEAWEALWHPAKDADPNLASFLQGLIQCSASALKARMGEARGHAKLAELGLAKLESVADTTRGRYMGLDADAFALAFRGYVAEGSLDPDARPRIELDD